MQTALGGAGLAVAFNAPIGGTLFTLEEVTKSFRVKTVLATLFSCVAGVIRTGGIRSSAIHHEQRHADDQEVEDRGEESAVADDGVVDGDGASRLGGGFGHKE